jgi:hypothetical protein
MKARDEDTLSETADLPPTESGSPPWEAEPQLTLRPQTRLAGRYRIVRFLGQGTAGAVYEAEDLERAGLRVALKLLLRREPRALYRLKNEFRALAETVHPNLVGLHSLGVDPRGWFLVMDLIDPSTDFLRYVRAAEGRHWDETRLRSALSQLVRGIAVIHAAGKLHRDLKPGNVLVTREGRVVIVDFGLVGDLSTDGIGHSQDVMFAGTPAYTAPEQTLNQPIGAAADLYAVGVMLFEALTGQLPFASDTARELLERKTRELAPAASSLVADVPVDLNALCAALLQRDPAARPSTQQVLHELGEQPLTLDLEAPTTLPFVAREAELEALEAAAERARANALVLVAISGPSGIGKTALIERFLELMRRDRGIIFQGRCHPHERVPYKAFDALVDSLVRHLMRLSSVEAASLMPRDVALLSRLFPTLARVPAVQQMPLRNQPAADEPLLRARGFAALKELLARIADRSPLILCIDDLQWGDQDSAELLREILRAPGAPACLVVAAFRDGEPDEDDFVTSLRALPALERVDLKLEPLARSESDTLARSVLSGACSEAELRLVVDEAAGSPFLLKELGRDARARGRVASLRDAVGTRIAQLDTDARRLLEFVCLAGQPLTLAFATRVAEVGPQALPAVLASSLLRTHVRGGVERIERYHDRIRDAVVANIDPERRADMHARLAGQFAQDDHADPDLIAQHYRAAGRAAVAAPYLIQAGQRAARAFAFGRAAELYELALREHQDPDQRRALQLELASAYSGMGKVVAAAELYERAIESARDADERRALSGKAMLLHLLAGQIEHGARLLDGLCRQLGVPPVPRWRWLARVVTVWLALRYFLGRPIIALPVPSSDRHTSRSREQLDLCLRAAAGFSSSVFEHRTYFMLLSLLAIRKHRDVERWPLGMLWDLLGRSITTGCSSESDGRLAAQAIELARHGGDAEVLALAISTDGGRLVHAGRHAEAAAAYVESERVLVASGRTAFSVFAGARAWRLAAWFYAGELALMERYTEAWCSEARTLGDHFGELVVRVLGSPRHLGRDDPESARECAELLQTPLGKLTLFVGIPAFVGGEQALYVGDAAGALKAYSLARRTAASHTLNQISHHRVATATFLARAHLIAASERRDRARHLRAAEAALRRMERERSPFAHAQGALVRGSLAHLRGDATSALLEFERAHALFTDSGTLLIAAAMRDRAGRLRGGDQGAAMVAEARGAALALGARNPERWFRSLSPGVDI